ncbi:MULTISPECIES: BMP family ABC transporter substrate-binding protein [unclassified Exiguobacterium]|uniref:BMP family lipoprotein n=1 Tax=unclassified Exiguobacterium TaxID=2644629 RepID=UPI001BE5F01F|nr:MULTISPECIES: BMP family ABC transporter substrate-binding protein [unclassified Exiguobacterium]
MLKHWKLAMLATTISLAGCGSIIDDPDQAVKERQKMAVVLSDVGLGDQSFSDAAMSGMALLREKEDWFIDYRELGETKTYKVAFDTLAKEKPTVVVGLGFMGQAELEEVAKRYPLQQFALIDAVSELPNVLSVTFKEDEGSYLAGAAAALQSENETIGFVGGMKSPLIEKFEKGYTAGAKAVNPDIKVLVDYAEDFAAPEKGRTIANNQMKQQADVLFAAAGLTGSGVLEAAQAKGNKAIGVDSDQTAIAPDAVMTSMLKQVDLAITTIGDRVKEKGLQSGQIVLGVKEGAIQLAPIRNVTFSEKDLKQLEQLKQDVLEGKVDVQ